jgi:hypothetical protein
MVYVILECNDLREELTTLKNKIEKQQKNLEKRNTLMSEKPVEAGKTSMLNPAAAVS